MTYQLPNTVFEPQSAISLYEATLGADDLGSVLLVNTLLRACAALRVDPLWPAWLQDITADDRFPVTQLIHPDTQRGCDLLCSVLPGARITVKHGYRRAFYQELLANFAAYDGFFAAHQVHEGTRTQLYIACQHERLISAVEETLVQTPAKAG